MGWGGQVPNWVQKSLVMSTWVGDQLGQEEFLACVIHVPYMAMPMPRVSVDDGAT